MTACPTCYGEPDLSGTPTADDIEITCEACATPAPLIEPTARQSVVRHDGAGSRQHEDSDKLMGRSASG